MSNVWAIGFATRSGTLVAGISAVLVGSALAHCDSTTGPVIPEARAALENGDVTTVLKWVTQENEAEVKVAFARAVAVRAMGTEVNKEESVDVGREYVEAYVTFMLYVEGVHGAIVSAGDHHAKAKGHVD